MFRLFSRLLTTFLISFVTLACSSMMSKPYQGELKKTYIEITSLSKDVAYEKTMVWLAKNLGDSNQAIKIKDMQLGRLVAKILYPCKGLKRPDVVTSISTTDVNFNVDVSIKDKKIKYQLEMLGFTRSVYPYGNQEMPIAEDKGQKEAVDSCFENLRKTLQDALRAEPGDDKW